MIRWSDDHTAHPALIRIALALLVSAALCSSAAGQASEGESAASAAAKTAEAEDFSKPMGPSDPLNRGTPRGSMYGYIVAARDADYEKAARYLDLRQLAPKDRERGAELAREFKTVLDQTLWVDFLTLSDSSEGDTNDGLPPWQDLLGVIDTKQGPVRLLLQRVPRKSDGVRIWKISAATVARIPELDAEFSPLWLEEWLPAFLFDKHLLDIALWQWLALILLASAAWLIALLFAGSVIRVLGAALARTAKTLDSRIVHLVRGPAGLIITVALFAFGNASLGLALDVQQWLRELEKLVLAVAVTWLVLRLIDLGTLALRQHMERREQIGMLPALLPAQRVTKVVVVLVALLSVLGTLGVNVTAAVAGLGVGGIAVALAAQKTIENLFGGITLFADQPVRVGDFLRFGDQVGTVEEIGLRSTRIRTLDRTVISVPNGAFSNLHLENFATRDQMRLYAMIGVRYETTPEQLRYILVEVRKLLYAHERVTLDPARIRFVGFGAYSLDLEIFAYVDTSDWNDFLGVREDIYLRIMDIIEASGTGFAFPSQTLYLGRDESPSAERAREVAEEVQRWRERGEIFLPSFPAERIQAIENTLAYPPEGSPPSRQGTG